MIKQDTTKQDGTKQDTTKQDGTKQDTTKQDGTKQDAAKQNTTELDTQDFINAIKELGISGSQICIHSSMKAFGANLKCGMEGIVQAFLGQGCTIMVPTFSYRYGVKPVEKYILTCNGISDYSCFEDKTYADTEPFDVTAKEISVEDMGAFAKYILDHDKSVRGNHPLNSFTALGAQAQRLVNCQTWQDVYAPFEQLYDDNGYVLLIGVGLGAATAIHYAEQKAGRTPFIRWAYNDKKNVMPVSVGSCSRGFEHFNGVLENYAKKIKVAKCEWICYAIKDLVDICKQYIENDPRITHCGDPYCDRCNDAVSGGPVLYSGFWA